jgi:hypothetical protein
VQAEEESFESWITEVRFTQRGSDGDAAGETRRKKRARARWLEQGIPAPGLCTMVLYVRDLSGVMKNKCAFSCGPNRRFQTVRGSPSLLVERSRASKCCTKSAEDHEVCPWRYLVAPNARITPKRNAKKKIVLIISCHVEKEVIIAMLTTEPQQA